MKQLKIAIILTLIGFSASTSLQAQESKPTSESILNIEKFYYQKGFNDAGEKYYKRGYIQAIKDIKRKLTLFKKRHEAIEASKYLSLTGKITYPEVFKIKDGNGGFKIKIVPPRVEKTFSVYDLINVPNGEGIERLTNKELSVDTKKISKAFYGENDTINKENRGILLQAKDINNETTLAVPKTRKNRVILDVSGVSYTTGKNKYDIYFKDKLDKQIFCSGVGRKICK